MYKLDDLQQKKVADLKEIATKLNLKKFEKLNKTDLIYKILDEQASTSSKEIPEKKEDKSDSKKKSASEALVNSFGGYPVGYALGIVILPLLVKKL